MIVGTLGVLYTLTLLKPVPTAPPEKLAEWAKDPSLFPGFSPEIVSAVNYNSDIFPWFLAAFLFVFAATGIGNGSTYRMIPLIQQTQATKGLMRGHRRARLRRREVHQGVQRGHRHRRRHRCPRWLPDPADVQHPVGDRPGGQREDAFADLRGLLRGLPVVTWFVYTRKTFLVHGCRAWRTHRSEHTAEWRRSPGPFREGLLHGGVVCGPLRGSPRGESPCARRRHRLAYRAAPRPGSLRPRPDRGPTSGCPRWRRSTSPAQVVESTVSRGKHLLTRIGDATPCTPI